MVAFVKRRIVKSSRQCNDLTIHDSTDFKSQVRIAGRQHGGETRHFFLAAAFFAGLFKRAAAADDFQRALAVDFFLKPAQRAFHRFAFF